MNDNLETNNTEQSVAPESTISEPVNSLPITSDPISTPNTGPDTTSRLTSFTSEEIASPAPQPAVNESVSPIEDVAKKEVVTRPLLWGIVAFLVFFALVIGAVSVYRYYQDQNKPVQDASILPANTPDTQGALDTIPVSTDTSAQADAISTEIQAIDTDIEGDVFSDSSLGL
jgi:uncharacterized protein HemX